MTFVGWVTAAALLSVGAGGAYGAISSLLKRRLPSPYRAEGRGVVLLGIIYLACGFMSLLAFVALLLGPAGL